LLCFHSVCLSALFVCLFWSSCHAVPPMTTTHCV
jgi:hypothetical protein